MQIMRQPKSVNILVTGSSGLIGSALVSFLAEWGHGVTRLVRRTRTPGEGFLQHLASRVRNQLSFHIYCSRIVPEYTIYHSLKF